MSDCVFDLALIIKLLKAFTNYYYFHENLLLNMRTYQ